MLLLFYETSQTVSFLLHCWHDGCYWSQNAKSGQFLTRGPHSGLPHVGGHQNFSTISWELFFPHSYIGRKIFFLFQEENSDLSTQTLRSIKINRALWVTVSKGYMSRHKEIIFPVIWHSSPYLITILDFRKWYWRRKEEIQTGNYRVECKLRI